MPAEAWAWTPGTHVFLGDAILRSISLLPTVVADLLRAFPQQFLYGSIAADTSIAKKYAPAGYTLSLHDALPYRKSVV